MVRRVDVADRAQGGAAISLADVSKAFGQTAVLQRVALSVAPGEFVAIVGRSGSGKSTLLRLLAGLDQPNDGSIEIAAAPSDIRMMFQEHRLLPWRRVIRNVGLGHREAGWQDAAQAALAAVGLGDRGDDWPAILSGGQRQRVALARALVGRPKLLLLDEPLGALDALTRLEMQTLIEQVWRTQGFTAILVTHDVGEAVALADRVVLIEDGAITYEERIPLDRPRRRGTADFAAIEGRILNRILNPDQAAGAGRQSYDAR